MAVSTALKFLVVSAVKYDRPSREGRTKRMVLSKRSQQIYLASQVLVFLAAIAATTMTSRSEDWRPLPLAALLLLFAAIGEWATVSIGSQNLSAGFIALVLAMTLLGPAPAVAIGLVAITVDTIHRRPALLAWLKNFTAYAVYLLLGGLFCRLLVGDVHDVGNRHLIQSPAFALVVFGVFVVALLLNFVLIAAHARITLGQGLMHQAKTQLVPMLPSQLAAATLAAIIVLAYTNLGYSVLVGLVVVILIFQYLTIALLRSEDRAEQLEARTVRLASMQLGMLVTLVETLALRDRATARHAAAVARYARELAQRLSCNETEQELVHTAGLLHDIGKFALPDRILHAEILSDDDWAVVRRHPQEGATLVGRLDGYGPVADAILYHHEHVDGSGYPAGLIGNEIPLASRIIAVCSVYDTLTARDTYRSPMTVQDAIAELRRVAGRQLDAEIVEALVTMLERDGPVIFPHGDDADFEAELAFERRARALAQPTLH